MPTQTLLIVDADTLIRTSLKAFLENHNYKVCEAGTIEDIIKHDLSAYSAIVCDEQQIELIRLAATIPVIVTSAQASLRSAVMAMKHGAADYLAKPFDFDELKSTIHDLTCHRNTYQQIQMLGTCDAIKSLNNKLDRVGPTDTNVLIEGESGTGKELVARNLHRLSTRAEQPFIKVNCAAFSANLIESELFGHEKGAFTGANERRKGRFELADNGTLFLDEIAELPLELQSKLLRVLQEHEFERVGGTHTLTVNIRVIAATNRNLWQMVEQGSFRMDLYYRLNVFPIRVPALRERKEDIPLLAANIINQLNKRLGKHFKGLTKTTLAQLANYEWPGNIRELQNILEREAILSKQNVLQLSSALSDKDPASGVVLSLDAAQKQHICTVLKQCHGKISGEDGAATLLELPESTLRSKMKKLGIKY